MCDSSASAAAAAAAYPAGAGLAQLSLHVDIIRDGEGGCRITMSAPEGSTLVAKYGGKALALKACRDFIIKDLDSLIEAFHDEE